MLSRRTTTTVKLQFSTRQHTGTLTRLLLRTNRINVNTTPHPKTLTLHLPKHKLTVHNPNTLLRVTRQPTNLSHNVNRTRHLNLKRNRRHTNITRLRPTLLRRLTSNLQRISRTRRIHRNNTQTTSHVNSLLINRHRIISRPLRHVHLLRQIRILTLSILSRHRHRHQLLKRISSRHQSLNRPNSLQNTPTTLTNSRLRTTTTNITSSSQLSRTLHLSQHHRLLRNIKISITTQLMTTQKRHNSQRNPRSTNNLHSLLNLHLSTRRKLRTTTRTTLLHLHRKSQNPQIRTTLISPNQTKPTPPHSQHDVSPTEPE